MGYRGRKRRLKNFWSNAQEIMNSFMRGKTTKPVRRSGRWIRKGTDGKRIVVKGADHLQKTLLKNQMLKEKIAKSDKKPKKFAIVYPKDRVFMKEEWGVQEYFNKPNAEQLNMFFDSAKHSYKTQGLTKEEYTLCKQFLKNPKNKGLTSYKISESIEELRKWTRNTRYDSLLHPTNVIVQGINRDGKLRLTIIDV